MIPNISPVGIGLGLVIAIFLWAALRPRRYPPVAAHVSQEQCKLPPAGWQCTRAEGHDGPCAAIPYEPPVSITLFGKRVDICVLWNTLAEVEHLSQEKQDEALRAAVAAAPEVHDVGLEAVRALIAACHEEFECDGCGDDEAVSAGVDSESPIKFWMIRHARAWLGHKRPFQQAEDRLHRIGTTVDITPPDDDAVKATVASKAEQFGQLVESLRVAVEDGPFSKDGVPICRTCGEEFSFDQDEPFAHCRCGTSEWGHSGDPYRRIQAARNTVKCNGCQGRGRKQFENGDPDTCDWCEGTGRQSSASTIGGPATDGHSARQMDNLYEEHLRERGELVDEPVVTSVPAPPALLDAGRELMGELAKDPANFVPGAGPSDASRSRLAPGASYYSSPGAFDPNSDASVLNGDT